MSIEQPARTDKMYGNGRTSSKYRTQMHLPPQQSDPRWGLVRLGVTLGAVHLAIVAASVKANCTKLSSIGARNLCHRLLSYDVVSGWSVWLASGGLRWYSERC